MIDCMKKYKMVLSSLDGEVVYKSDYVDIDRAQAYNVEGDRQATVEIAMTAWGMQVEEAGMAPEMPTAEVAAKASQIIQMENRKRSVKEEWLRLTNEVCKAVKAGDEKIFSRVIFEENKERLEKMGYHLALINAGTFEHRIAWAGILFGFTS